MPELHVNHKRQAPWAKYNARTTNLTGVVVNEFEITGYVGIHWETSMYATFKHVPCGATGTVLVREAKFRLGQRKCKCGKATQSSLTPAAYASCHNNTT